MRISRALAVLTVPVALLAAGCSDDSDTADDTTTTEAPATTEAPDPTEAPATTEAPEASGTIVDIAAGNPDFSTLVDLVGKAGLAEALSGEGSFTVFAPTNEAFGKVDAATLEPLTELGGGRTAVALLAARVGPTRLIDNAILPD